MHKSIIWHYSQFFMYPTTSQTFCKFAPQSSTLTCPKRVKMKQLAVVWWTSSTLRNSVHDPNSLTCSHQTLAHISCCLSLFFCFIPSSFITTFSHLSLHSHLLYLHCICSGCNLNFRRCASTLVAEWVNSDQFLVCRINLLFKIQGMCHPWVEPCATHGPITQALTL
jgi:hypothetical protein